MSTNYTIRARRNFSDLVDKNNDDKMIKDDGHIREIMEQEVKKRKEFEYVPKQKDKVK